MKFALLGLQYLPVILQAVVAVEKAIGSGNGQTKKKIILDAVQAGAKVVGQVDHEEVAAVGNLVDSVVGALNQSGLLDGKPKEVVK